MKKFLIFVFVLFCAAGALAQPVDVSNLLDIQNRNKQQSSIYNGQPFVLIGEPVKEAPETTSPEPTTPTVQLPEYKITTPFGQNTTAAFIDHTTDYNTIVQVIDKNTVLMEEHIQFVTTQPTTFKREIPLELKNIKNAVPLTVTWISAKKHGKDIHLKTEQTDDAFIVTDTTPLQTGVHRYVLRYMIHGTLLQGDASTRLVLSLTGTKWPYPVERFSTLMLFPDKTSIFEKNILFGTNNVAIKESFETQTDDKGNLSFRLTRPLPANADVKIILFFDGSTLPPAANTTFTQQYPNWFVFILIFGAQIIYISLAALLFKVKKNEAKPMKFFTSWPLFVLRYATGLPLSAEWIQKLRGYTQQTKRFRKSTALLSLCQKRRPLRLFVSITALIFVAFKYLATQLVLMVSLGLFAEHIGISLTNIQYIILGLTAIILTLIITKWGALPHLRHNIRQAENMLLKPDFGFGLSKQASKTLFLRYYPYLLTVGKGHLWTQNQTEYNDEIGKMIFEREDK